MDQPTAATPQVSLTVSLQPTKAALHPSNLDPFQIVLAVPEKASPKQPALPCSTTAPATANVWLQIWTLGGKDRDLWSASGGPKCLLPVLPGQKKRANWIEERGSHQQSAEIPGWIQKTDNGEYRFRPMGTAWTSPDPQMGWILVDLPSEADEQKGTAARGLVPILSTGYVPLVEMSAALYDRPARLADPSSDSPVPAALLAAPDPTRSPPLRFTNLIHVLGSQLAEGGLILGFHVSEVNVPADKADDPAWQKDMNKQDRSFVGWGQKAAAICQSLALADGELVVGSTPFGHKLLEAPENEILNAMQKIRRIVYTKFLGRPDPSPLDKPVPPRAWPADVPKISRFFTTTHGDFNVDKGERRTGMQARCGVGDSWLNVDPNIGSVSEASPRFRTFVEGLAAHLTNNVVWAQMSCSVAMKPVPRNKVQATRWDKETKKAIPLFDANGNKVMKVVPESDFGDVPKDKDWSQLGVRSFSWFCQQALASLGGLADAAVWGHCSVGGALLNQELRAFTKDGAMDLCYMVPTYDDPDPVAAGPLKRAPKVKKFDRVSWSLRFMNHWNEADQRPICWNWVHLTLKHPGEFIANKRQGARSLQTLDRGEKAAPAPAPRVGPELGFPKDEPRTTGAPTITAFEGWSLDDKGKKKAALGDAIVADLGGELVLEWTVEGDFDHIELQHAGDVALDLTPSQLADTPGRGRFRFKYGDTIRAKDGDLVLVARREDLRSQPATLHVVCIDRFEVRCSKANPGLLYTDNNSRTPVADAAAGRARPRTAWPNLSIPDGKITAVVALKRDLKRPKQATGNAVSFHWSVCGADRVRTVLLFNRLHGRQFLDSEGKVRSGLHPCADLKAQGFTGKVAFDVTETDNTLEVIEDSPPDSGTFDAWLLLFEKKSEEGTLQALPARTPDALACIRVAHTWSNPEILDFFAINLAAKSDRAISSIGAWGQLGLSYRLNDGSSQTRLVLSASVLETGNELFVDFDLKAQGPGPLKNKVGPIIPDPGLPFPYTVRFVVEQRNVYGAPLCTRSLDLQFANTVATSPALISIKEALRQRNGSYLDLFAKAPTPLARWGPLSATCAAPATRTGASTPVWAWEHPGPARDRSGSFVIENLRARVRDFSFAQYQVADRISWDPVSITTADNQHLKLPFEERFFLDGITASDGENPGTSSRGHYWKLAARLDRSLRLVFGYELHDGAMRPLDRGADGLPVLDRKQLPRCPSPAPQLDLAREATNPVPESDPLRIIVVVSLLCMRERVDFAPGPILGAGRIFPTVSLLSNRDLAEASHRFVLARPATSDETDTGVGGVSAHMCCHEMLPRIGSMLFTDSNTLRMPDIVAPMLPLVALGLSAIKRFVALPLWCNFFDYYETNAPPGERFQAITRKGPGTTGEPQTVDVLLFPKFEMKPILNPLIPAIIGTRVPMLTGPAVYKSMPVQKMPRQGEFDNLHLAPLMSVPSSTLALPTNAARFATPPVAGRPTSASWGLDEVAMAPFCVHDCLHTHWRWGSHMTDTFTLGWQDFDPFSRAGNPTVPGNQSVLVSLSASAAAKGGEANVLDETGTAHDVEAGRWQVFHHQGLAYALAVTELRGHTLLEPGLAGIDTMALAFEEPLIAASTTHIPIPSWVPPKIVASLPGSGTIEEPLLAMKSYAAFYWRLRFGGGKGAPKERLLFTPAQLAAYRKDGL